MRPPRSGYTLPVYACAAAIAALRQLQTDTMLPVVSVDLIEPAKIVEIPVEQVAKLSDRSALAITRSDPGDNLDLTRHTPIWALVEWGAADQPDVIALVGGEGIGRLANGQPAIYRYAQQLLIKNLKISLKAGETIRLTLILPEGRTLAKRTSNEAFGVVEGLSLLGTTGISQPLSAPGQLEAYRQELQQKAAQFDCLVFCVGENGLDLCQQRGIDAGRLVKTANWLGPMLVEAGVQGVQSILLFGYHGKLLKLAGGIFHTHHHVADGRLEILTAHCANLGLPATDLQAIFQSATAEDALTYLSALKGEWVERVYDAIADTIDDRAQTYIRTHSGIDVSIGTVLFNRQRKIIITSKTGAILLHDICS
ncbi:MAG: cobalt-precorrin-5B (C(1))-methyltransferase [Oscillatoriales cyanobacterium C42_A2020_001]|nr:cobalt-precorrin-5B (C(1))-methyltransferase [Leptolyngbyaceae cyanobacterium C42_A2020_001]